MLYIGKLIIDEAVRLVGLGVAFDSLGEAWRSGLLQSLLWLLVIEFALAIVSDLLGRLVSYAESLLSELFTNATSIRLMEHAATLDLEDFEDPELQDKLDRARRQTMGRSNLMAQIFGQVQDIITVASFAVGLLVYAPWLILLLAVALIPAFIGESHFNALGYSLNFQWTPERRQLEYVRQTGASVESAKEVKIFNLHRFLVERYRTLAEAFYKANRALARRRAFWGALLAALGTLGYYIAYGYIAWRTVRGDFTIGDLTFLAGSFRRLRQLLEGLMVGFSQVASQALYLDDLFSFFAIEPEIRSPENPAPFPKPVREGLVFENVGFRYPDAARGRGAGAGGRERRRQDHPGEAAGAAVRPGRGPDPARRPRPARVRPGRGAGEHRGDLPGLRALSPHRRREHRRGPDRRDGRRGADPRGGAAGDGGRGGRRTAGRLRPAHRPPFPHRGGPLGRAVAEDRHRAGLHARCAGDDPGRAHGGAGRAQRVRGVPAFQGAVRRAHGGADLAPLLVDAHGGPDPGDGTGAD